MAFKLSIGRKLGFGFGTIILLTVLAFLFTNVTLNDSKKKTDEVVQIVTPSVAALEEFNMLLNSSQSLITKWYYVQSSADDPFKKELRDLMKITYPKLKLVLDTISSHWPEKDKKEIREIFKLTDKLFDHYNNEIMSQLVDFSSYENSQLYFMVKLPFDEISDKIGAIYARLNGLILAQKENASMVTQQMFKSFNFLQQIMKWLGIALVVGGIFVAFITARSIVNPVQVLKRMLLSMSKGMLPKETIPERSDEIGEMNHALKELIGALEGTTQFAYEVGSGNFESNYKPLSDQDTLGHALLKMRYNLAENERILEKKVIERTEEVVRQKEEIETKNEQLEILYKQVTDSIRYAKRIQEAILPPARIVNEVLPQSFVLYKPKDIVSGDFYWVEKKNGRSMVAAVDCTGHGVPGAFMSIVGYNLLKDIVTNSDLVTPSVIMDLMSEGVNRTLHNKTADDSNQTKDGMDMTMLSIDFENRVAEFSGAFNPLYLVRGKELLQYKADKFPIGLRISDQLQHFSNQKIDLQKGDTLYIFSDGYADQFGGDKGKKFMAGRFRELLVEVAQLPIEKQKEKLNYTIESWRGVHEQVDDILVIGVRV